MTEEEIGASGHLINTKTPEELAKIDENKSAWAEFQKNKTKVNLHPAELQQQILTNEEIKKREQQIAQKNLDSKTLQPLTRELTQQEQQRANARESFARGDIDEEAFLKLMNDADEKDADDHWESLGERKAA